VAAVAAAITYNMSVSAQLIVVVVGDALIVARRLVDM
jgi:hypothetical protein